ncbi:hypothetical protein LTR56_018377 [Elasticomyces elasticus]|nr:hypothetical protein LTR56_018377 [Elasticomyces elasticus]KAK3637277.1 hypothetical protein LTR22_018311 [Elasticomyces elasticus]KAK4916450.1 hypothetical protein LTR49_015548 [Elasticomyces elasticus]KAK5756003.1 hypothetical protein LTS12_013892 [Elasticomyces elasticus]
MPPKTIFYIYTPDKPRTAQEEIVKQMGFPIVSTTELNGFIDRLYNHRYYSRNTHCAVSGSIQVFKPHDNDLRSRPEPKFAGDWIDVPSNVTCISVPGKEGIAFVEGHMLLSPTTAERMLGRDAIIKAPKANTWRFHDRGGPLRGAECLAMLWLVPRKY